MNKVLRAILLSLPALACSVCGSIFMLVFWLRHVPVGALDLTQTLLVSIACYVSGLVYLCTLGYCYSKGRCSGNQHEDHVELSETTEEENEM
jgi:hypothetical protein